MASSELISNAPLVTTLTGDSIVSVASGVGQPSSSIKVSDLATVVAGLIDFPFSYRETIGFYGTIKDFNNATRSGVYEMEGSGIENEPPTTKMYGVLVVMATESCISQTSFHNENNEVYSRLYSFNNWSSWVRLSNV